MKTREPVSSKKQSVTVKDLTTKKNPKGGAWDGTQTVRIGDQLSTVARYPVAK